MPPAASVAFLPANAIAGPSDRPFQCDQCLKRFTRHENLKRHMVLHTQSESDTSFACDYCSTTFARQDLRRRHVKYKHPELAASLDSGPASSEFGKAGSKGRRGGSSSLRGMPTTTTQSPTGSPPGELSSIGAGIGGSGMGVSGVLAGGFDNGAPTLGVGPGTWDFDLFTQASPGSIETIWTSLSAMGSGDPTAESRSNSSEYVTGIGLIDSWDSNPSASTIGKELNPNSNRPSPESNPSVPTDWQPSPSQVERGIDLYFRHLSPSFPFLHQPTLTPSTTPIHLLLGVCCLGFQYGQDASASNEQEQGEDVLSLQCYQVACANLGKLRDHKNTDPTEVLAIVQTYLLVQLYAMMYLGGEAGTDGLRMHAKAIRLSRSNGLMQPLATNPTGTSDLDSLWKEFIRAESHKRTILALHHLDSLWYQILSVPRSISHLEIKHDMPCQASLWGVPTAADWAHRSLSKNGLSAPVQYAEAIRLLLSPLDHPDAVPQLELQGALNVIHFLQTSLREVSGWSAMVGRVSLERLEALNASLTAIEPYIRSQAQAARGSPWVVVEATWQMARLETVSWSASHMGGIVESSPDGALATAAHLAASQSGTIDGDIARSLVVHIDWFLVYLEGTVDPSREPPFVTIYAFKAFLIAWQLVRSSVPSAMSSVGINDGDSEAALAWAVKVFTTRQRWKVGRLIVQNLVSLAEFVAATG